jgi:hypothetical protein
VSTVSRFHLTTRRLARRSAAVGVIAVAGALCAAPAASAVTVTPLGKCSAPNPPYPVLERLAVPGTVKLAADGRPTGVSVGISIRNFTMAYQGSGVDLYVDVLDPSTGKPVGGVNVISWDGCARYLWSMRELNASYPGSGPMTLKRGKLYAVRASAGFLDWGGADPTYGLLGLVKSPIAVFVAV